MLEELKRCNYIGEVDGILFVIGFLGNHVSIREILDCCSLRPDINVNCHATLALLEYLGCIERNNGMVLLTATGVELIQTPNSKRIDYITKHCIVKLIQEGLFDENAFEFDQAIGKFFIRQHTFPLSMAAIRNYLITTNVIERMETGDYEINNVYEETMINKVISRRKALSLEQLLTQQKKQQEQGLLAEEFVLKYERSRLHKHPYIDKVKRISDLDVAAGFDIVSFRKEDDFIYNKFIEVKSYRGIKHFFWSENEIDVAKLKNESYFLCLVDMDQIHNDNYEPEFIHSPASMIFKDEEWLISPTSYKFISTK
jgi:hypothetical protein